jgi:hypothetical protein
MPALCYALGTMRPKLLTPRNLILLLLATTVLGGLARWGSLGFPLPGQGVPSTAGKLVYVTAKDDREDLALLDPATSTSVAMTTDGQANDEPEFNPDGTVLYYTAERGGIRQLCVMDAAPGRHQVALTRTTTTKQQPQARPGGRVYFVDGGKVSATTRDASDPHAVFPSATELNDNPYLKALFKEGGIEMMALAPDETTVAITINRERGQLLVVYVPEDGQSDGSSHGGTVAILGLADRIVPQFTKGGMLGALFTGGAPFQKAMQLPKLTDEEAGLLKAEMREVDIPIPPLEDTMKDTHVLAQFGPDLSLGAQFQLPVSPKELAFAPGKEEIVLVGGTSKEEVGLVLLQMTGEKTQPKMLFDKTCQNVAWSPDSSQIAFSDGTDIFLVPSDGSSPPKNLTQGKAGKATSPVWSPAKK